VYIIRIALAKKGRAAIVAATAARREQKVSYGNKTQGGFYMKRLLFVLVVLLTAGLVFAAGEQEQATGTGDGIQLTPKGTFPIVQEKVTLT
jgi:hypothetical protein